ncbi:hypothetical protein H5410_040002 [Solanum commersonii]|uniref:GRF-type domain-containing protein n=1 Tax=Solanum commersonii TaxID=4109 RepID=A0A9J5XQU6_SOLCO|nr:hypothetical protein H5410_040002 [Solanum commersonii]
MSQNLVNIEEADICKCGDYCQLKTLKTPLNLGRRFFGCRASKMDDSSLENTDESSRFVSWNRFIDGENSIDRLKRKMKELEGERFFEISIESK